jgi:L-ribulokinase
VGLSLHSSPAEVYRALIEGTAFGARVIVERLVEGGVPVDEVICCGGIAEKNALLMQIYADILNRPMKVSRSSETCALGSAIFGAVVGGVYSTTEEAQEKMTGLGDVVYDPDANAVRAYDELYEIYRSLHDSFGLAGEHDMSRVMKDLIAIRTRAAKA